MNGGPPYGAGTDEGLRAREDALRLLSRRALSEAELRSRLRARGVSGEVANFVVAECVARGYIDEREIAKSVIERARRLGRGRYRLAGELRHRLLKAETIEECLKGVDGAEEISTAHRVSGAMSRGLSRAQLSARLARRGFDTATIRRTLREAEEASPSSE